MKADSPPADIHGKVMLSSASELNKTHFPPPDTTPELVLTGGVHSPVKRVNKAVSAQAETYSFKQGNAEAAS